MQTKSGNGHNVNLERLMEDIKTVVKDGEALLKTGMTEVKERAKAGAKTTDKAVRNYPYQSMSAVFGLGIVVGLVAARLFSRGDVEMEEEE